MAATKPKLLTKGLEIIPQQRIVYKGRVLAEMDIDAILARQPRLVLVDELAHTNAPGSRHPKRYLDVEELLAAGIDVYTTLNIQHVESLNDVVARITRIRVRETVPDSIIDHADDIEVVDLTPEDLIQRLNEGKVYVPSDGRARGRQLFLARQSDGVARTGACAARRSGSTTQMVDYMRAHAIAGPWPAGERVLVRVNEAPARAALVRYGAAPGRSTARALDGASMSRLARSARRARRERDRIAEALRLAQRLGGEAVTVPAARMPTDRRRLCARRNNVTHIVRQRSPAGRAGVQLSCAARSAQKLHPRAGDINVHVVPSTESRRKAKRLRPTAPQPVADGRPMPEASAIVAAALAIALVLLREALGDLQCRAGVPHRRSWRAPCAYGSGRRCVACLVGVLAYNFFFLPPLYTFTIADPENVVALFFFAVVAVIASNLAARLRAQAW